MAQSKSNAPRSEDYIRALYHVVEGLVLKMLDVFENKTGRDPWFSIPAAVLSESIHREVMDLLGPSANQRVRATVDKVIREILAEHLLHQGTKGE